MEKEKLYNQFLKKIEDCEGCGMRNFGEPVFCGNFMQEMMIIGYEPESHNVHIDSKVVAKTSSLLSLYENEIKYGAYITYIYRCSLHVHGDLNDDARQRCKGFLKEEYSIISPKYVIIYDERVIDEICDDPEAVKAAADYPVESTIFGHKTKIYFIK